MRLHRTSPSHTEQVTTGSMESAWAISRPPPSVATSDIQMTFEVLILASSISTSDHGESATNTWMQKDLYLRSQAEKLLGLLEQYECQNVGDAVKPHPVYVVDSDGFYKAHSAEPIAKGKGGLEDLGQFRLSRGGCRPDNLLPI